MIYLIQDCYKNDNGEYVDILKIGYSDKPFKQSRNSQYKTHNYGYKLIGEREGDTRFEHYLHEKYKDFRLSPDTEWFLYDQSIVDEFFTIDENEVNIILTKEQYVFQVREYLLSTITKPTELYSKYAIGLIEALSKEPRYDIEEKAIYEDRIYNTFEFVYSLVSEEIEIDCVYSNKFFNDIPEKIDSDWLVENPWKNRAELYFKVNTVEKTQEEFNNYLEKKLARTNDLLNLYNRAEGSEKHSYTIVCRDRAQSKKYKDDFVAVSKHSGADMKPVKNTLVIISEMRAFEIQQYDYKERFTVFNSISDQGINVEDINSTLDRFFSFKSSSDKLKYLCSLPESTIRTCLPHLPDEYINYMNVLGIDRIRANGYNISDVRKEYKAAVGNKDIDIKSAILAEFNVGDKLPKSEVKNRLKDLYLREGYSKTARAIDLGDYFIIKNCKIPKPDGGRDNGYEIVSIKEETITDLTQP